MERSDNIIMMPFEPKRPYQEIGLVLRKELIEGLYQVGDRLPPERDIADRLDVSRTVVREAIIMLELENLVEVKKGSGVYVLNIPTHSRENVVSDDAGPFEMLQARQLLESNIAEFAATQVTPGDIIKMRSALELEREELASGTTDCSGDERFHMCIAEATQNSVLVDMLKQSWDRREKSPMWNKLHSHISGQDYREEWLDDHARILAALQRKDPVAAKNAMWQHLENVKQRLLALSDIDDPNFDGYLFSSNPVLLLSTES
ncbi:GntR family transcriptional regulator [Vibrio crassostreae]|uniref:FCD domain-containing protein n=1 Tax=Vibrio crassostreae TaxID=246167 RepID=UPI000F4AC85B|nr:FCD domain-containing protein [Vibrio crassostreae]ROO72493.1 GntR family transcriptional regulator [Vibrio crassostreae]ROP10374.1 GntR family transcriptional regulator [Vibrio crassostreae]ROQ80043.1 GntR family transcriptional regulator [Vibrio crassostreae]ROR85214.1 GntR family transcriptional regulator [Vibrio crassostreae]RPE93135.1 GntR family transcriptional regulator [Vibrio crassostreae]